MWLCIFVCANSKTCDWSMHLSLVIDAAQNVLEVMLEFAPGSSEWRHWFNMFVALYTATKTTARLTIIK